METAMSKSGWVPAACAMVVAWAGSLPVPAQAMSVWYEADLLGGNASGTMNGVPFSNADLQFDFFGDTSTVQPFSFTDPATGSVTTGYINLTGSATFNIWDSNTYAMIGSGTFQPSAGIFVSVDNTNGGIGFGSFGVPPGDPNFPGQPVYPGSILVPSCCVSPNVTTYDLQSTFFVPGELSSTGSARRPIWPVRDLRNGQRYFVSLHEGRPQLMASESRAEPRPADASKSGAARTPLTLRELAGDDPQMLRNVDIARRIAIRRFRC